MPFDIGNAGTVAPPRPRRPAAPNPLGGVLTDPGFVQAQLAHQQQVALANQALRQQRSQALVGFGDPGLARSLGGAVDPNTAGAAGANQFSTLANLGHDQQIAMRQIPNFLAGHGLLHSGDLGYREGEQTRNYGQALYGAHNQLLDLLNQQLGGYTNQMQGANDSFTNALLQAYYRQLGNPLGQLGG